MVIENPRGGEEVRFEVDMRPFAGTIINIGNDYPDPDDGLVDWVWVDMSVVPPDGSLSAFADIAVFLYGPAAVLPDRSLPPELDLADWPHAIIEFRDNFLHQDPTEIFAEIYSLSPVVVAAGDYDSDGVVDSDDYALWVRGSTTDWPEIRNGDGNGDGIVGAADYVVWRNALANAAGSAVDHAIPEPATMTLFLIAAAAARVGRWRRAGVCCLSR
jgi:hypothetical protein